MKKLKSDLKEPNKIPVTFNELQWCYIEEYKGIFGEKRAEVVRNIVLNWLLEQNKLKIKQKSK